MLLRAVTVIIVLVISATAVSGQVATSLTTSNGNTADINAKSTTKPLTLADVMERALSQPSAYRQAQLAELIAAEDVRQAKTALLPKVNTQDSYIYTTPGHAVPPTPDNPFPDRPPSFISANAINEYIVYLNIYGDLDISGRLSATLARTRAAFAAAHLQTEIAKKGLALSATDAFYGLALAQGNRVIAKDSLAAAQDFLKITQLLYSGGEVAESDVLKARIEVSNRQVDLDKAIATEQAAADTLRVLIMNDLNSDIEVENIEAAAPNVTLDLSAYNEQSISSRLEFSNFAAQLRAAEQEVKIAHREFWPQISYSINLGIDNSTFNFFHDRGASFTFNFKMPIFDWGEIRSRERQARLRQQTLENERAQASRMFQQQYYTARANVSSALRRINETRANINDAQRSLTLSIARYRAGEAPILEVTDARNTLAGVRSAYYQAIYDYQTNLARLEQAVGR